MILLLFSVFGFLDQATAAAPPSEAQFVYQSRLDVGKQAPPSLEHFPTPLGKRGFQLSPIDVWAPGATVVHHRGKTSVTLNRPSQTFYRGLTPDGQLLFLSRQKDGSFQGFLRGGQQTWSLVWREGRIDYQTAHAKALASHHQHAGILQAAQSHAGAQPAKNNGPRVVDVAFEADTALAGLFAGDEATLTATIAEAVAAVNSFYQTDLDVVLRIAYLAVFSDENPWGSSNDDFQNHWLDPANGKTTIQRHLAFRLEGRGSSGFAFIGGVANPNFGYGSVGFQGSFRRDPSDLSNITLLGHELGHSLGAIHTQDYFPPIDTCSNITGDIPADGGTIMSYCNFQLGGVLATRFHPQSVNLIHETLAKMAVLPTQSGALHFPDPVLQQTLLSGYDSDGDGALSLSEAEAVTQLDLRNLGVADLSGIHTLINLGELQASGNAVQRLPTQLPAALQILDLGNNPLTPENCALLAGYEARGFTQLTLTPVSAGGFLPCETRFVTFPDSGLHNAVLAAADADQDGRVSLKEAQGLTVLTASAAEIADITGIEALVNLRRLDLSDNGLISLPTLPGPITHLTLDNNQLTNIDAVDALTQLSVLKVNHNNLTGLPTFGGKTFFYTLEAAHNQLQNLPDLTTDLYALSNLDVSHNQLTEVGTLPEGLFNLNLSYNQLQTVPEIPAINYTRAQVIDISNNPFVVNEVNCSRLETLFERDTRNLTMDTSVASNICWSIPQLPPIRSHLPWLVNNERFINWVTITNHGSEGANVFMYAHDAQGSQFERLSLDPGERSENILGSWFPGMDQLSLSLLSFSEDVVMSTTLENLSGPSAGARAGTGADLYKTMPNKLLFTGLAGNSAVAFSAPGNTGPASVAVMVRNSVGETLAEQQITLTNAAPSAVLLQNLSEAVVGQENLTVFARIDEGKRLSGNSFLFEGWAEIAMARGQTVYSTSRVYAVPVGSDRDMTITLHNPNPFPVMAGTIVLDQDNPRGIPGIQMMPALGTLNLRPSDLYPGDGDIGLQIFAAQGLFATVSFKDEAGAGAPSPAFSEVVLGLELTGRALYDLAYDTTEASLYLGNTFSPFPETVFTVQLFGTYGELLGEQTVSTPLSVSKKVDVGTLFPDQELANKSLRVLHPMGRPVTTLLRQRNAAGRSSLSSSNGR